MTRRQGNRQVPKKIAVFLRQHHVLSLATTDGDTPFCANCFYVFDEHVPAFVFKSQRSTKHVQDALRNERVAGTVAVNTKKVSQIRGVQFTGIFRGVDANQQLSLIKSFTKAYPFARAFKGSYWAICPTFIRLVDNRYGFGKKMTWVAS